MSDLEEELFICENNFLSKCRALFPDLVEIICYSTPVKYSEEIFNINDIILNSSSVVAFTAENTSFIKICLSLFETVIEFNGFGVELVKFECLLVSYTIYFFYNKN